MSSKLEQLQRQILQEQHLRVLAEERAETEQRRREEEQRRREEEQRRREEEQRRREEEQWRREEQQRCHEERTGKSTLPRFLDACHAHLFLGLTIQEDRTQSTQGDPANAENKVRPDQILPWLDFAAHQTKIWDVLMNSDFVFQKHFTSLHTLEESGEQLRARQLSSELDLHHFARSAVEDPVALIIACLARDSPVRDKLGLRGSVIFENHGNMLSPDRELRGLQHLSISEKQPRRRSPRLQAREKQIESSARVARSPSPIASKPSRSRPRPDQFCVYSVSDVSDAVQRVPATTIEYKAPHKLTLGHIYAGLTTMNVADIVQVHLEEDVTRRCQRLVAAVITQEFASMIRSGLEYGLIFTGPAIIFLRIPEEDPSCVHFSLAVPHEDVGETTGWTPQLDQVNRLHLTAVGQLLAFTLRAIQSAPRDSRWRREAEDRLLTWRVTVEELEDDVPDGEVLSSEYRPPTGESSDFRLQSPVSRRLRRLVPRLQDSVHHLHGSPSPSGDEDDTATPSRADPLRPQLGIGQDARSRPPQQSHTRKKTGSDGSRRQRDLGPYCSPSCLKGLVDGSALDPTCPNIHHHGQGRHSIDFKEFQRLVRGVLREQLEYCEELYVHGAKGFLYRIRLPRWGYTVVAKGTRPEHINALKHEAMIYRRYLKSIQGIHIPVYLGIFNLQHPLYYVGLVPIKHMMLMSFGGYSLNHFRCPLEVIPDQAIIGLQAIHALGILQDDVAERNLLYDQHRRSVIWHDFDGAKVCTRLILAELSTNVGLTSSVGQKRTKDREPDFDKELKKARAMLRTRVAGPQHNGVLFPCG